MRILFLSQRFLLPMDTGGKIRTGNILEQLAKKYSITLVSNVESPKDDPYVEQMDRFSQRFVPVAWKEISKYSWKFFARLLVQMFSPYPVSALNSSSVALRLAVEHEIRENVYDLAICDFVQSALEFRNIHNLTRMLFQHNVESVIAKRHMNQAKNPFSKIFWWLQWEKMFAFEKDACRNFDTVIAVSEKDGEAFRTLYGVENVVTIPTGVDLGFFAPTPDVQPDQHTVAFCGSMDWLPNDDAAIFFIQEILPRVQQSIPDCRFLIVGRNPSPALSQLADQNAHVDVTGWVDDIRPYVAKAALVVVPIRIGGGTRMKIYEAMSMGKAIVSTSIGAEGLQFVNGEHLVLEDDAAGFARQIILLLNNVQQREQLGMAARKLVQECFGWERVADAFGRICIEAHRKQGPC